MGASRAQWAGSFPLGGTPAPLAIGRSYLIDRAGGPALVVGADTVTAEFQTLTSEVARASCPGVKAKPGRRACDYAVGVCLSPSRPSAVDN
jgi:hypothetical protein